MSATPPSTKPDALSGRVLGGKYAMHERLGYGAMGAVYRARHVETGGDVAVKLLHGTAALDDQSIKRFRLEAQNAAQLRHPNTVRVTDFGVDDGVFYLVMEHLHGRSLADAIDAEAPFPWRRAVHIARQILKALWEAHEHPRRIVHRDIKPANVFLVTLPDERDAVKVLDFGIARSLAGTGAGTQGLIGSPYYMPPEQWRGLTVDPRSDLYSLGCVVFQMLAGAPPFRPPPSASDVLMPLLSMHCHDAPPQLGDVAPAVPAPIARWAHQLIEKDPSARPASARAALEALGLAVTEADAAARVPTAHGEDAMAQPAPAPPVLDTAAALADTASADTPAPSVAAPPPRSPPAAAPSRSDGRNHRSLWVAAAVLVGVGFVVAAVAVAAGGSADTATTEAAEALTVVYTTDGEPPATQVAAYRARLGPADHVDDDGDELIAAADVIVRDRVNVHANSSRDAADEADDYFVDEEAWTYLRGVVDAVVDARMAHEIVHGTPLVDFTFYTNGIRIAVHPGK